MNPSTLTVWVDPGCPWAWQTARWVRDLRDRGLFTIEWRLFSLEVNTSGLDMPFDEAADRYGEALISMALAHRDAGDQGLEDYYVALGTLLHDHGEQVSPEVVRRAADNAGTPGLVDRAAADPGLADEVRQAYRDARELDVFGVPTLRLDDGPPVYGPIMPQAPEGDDALEWWRHIAWLIGRDDIYELKRWPRTRKPGRPFTSS